MEELKTFERKSFRVQAIRITAGNIHEIAKWCGGVYKAPENAAPYILVPRGTQGNTVRGYTGDWVTRLTSANNYHVYKNHVFKETFFGIPTESEKILRIAHVFVQYLPEQYSGEDPYSKAIEAARKVLQHF